VGGLGKRVVSTPKDTLKQGSGPAVVFCADKPGQDRRALVQSKSLAFSASCTVTNRAGVRQLGLSRDEFGQIK